MPHGPTAECLTLRQKLRSPEWRGLVLQTICNAIVAGGTRGYAAMFQFGHGDKVFRPGERRPPGARAMSQMRHVAGRMDGGGNVNEDELDFFEETMTEEERSAVAEAVRRGQERTGRIPTEAAA